MAITDWPEGERPRERLLLLGPQALSDAELLAIFLRVGIRGKSAVDLARDLLARVEGNLGLLADTPIQDLIQLPGLGPAKAAQLAAALELARRSLFHEMKTRDLMTSPSAVRDWLRLRLGRLPHETFGALWLDVRNRLIGYEELFRGSLTQTSVYPREVIKRALDNNAAAVILAHNHPSGLTEPSAADELLTRNLRDTLALVEVRLLDHFIIAGNQTPLSLAERGII